MTIYVKRRKKCTKCGELKALELFGNHSTTKDHRQSWCKECVASRQRPTVAQPGDIKCLVAECLLREARSGCCARHYKLLYRNGDPRLQKRASSTDGKSAAFRKQWVREYKVERGCTDCGYNTHWAALDFDHLPGTVKVRDIKAGQQLGWKALLAEIAKCEVVCANCHRIRTVSRGREVMPNGRK